MTTRHPYHATIDRNGTEDEIAIRNPDGRCIAFIWLWEEPDNNEARQKKGRRQAHS